MNLNLTQSEIKVQLSYDEKSGRFTWNISKARLAKYGQIAGCAHPNGYRYIRVNGRGRSEHRLVWMYMYGVWPQSHIDHINGDKSDNRISNIREATRSENMRNRGVPKNNTSGFVGVHFNKRYGTYTAQTVTGGKKKHLGTFTSTKDASNAYQAYAKKHVSRIFQGNDMTNLYQLTATQHALVTQLEAADFDAQTISDTLEGEENTEALKEKRLGYIAIIKQKQALATMRQAAAADIMALAENEWLAAGRLEAALFKNMQATGDKDLIGVEFEAHIQGKAAAVEITDPALVPRKYWVTPESKPPVAAISKTLLGVDLKAGVVIEGAMLGANKKLVIK